MSGLLDQYGRPFSATDAATPNPRSARMRNVLTGAGTRMDKGMSAEIVAQNIEREMAERMYQMSWAAARLVDIIVDDMFAAGRRWTSEDEGKNKAMEDAEADLRLWERLPDAIKAGRVFGTGVLIVAPTDGAFDQPLQPEQIKEGGIANLIVVDRWSMNVQNWHTDPSKPRYSEPYQYRWSGRIFGSSEG